MDAAELERLLTARHAELSAELARLTEPPAQGTNLSFGKRIGDGTTEAVERISSTAAARSIAASIAEVERALAKIEDGTYGTCNRCGRPIAEERLDAIPWTSLCVDCSRNRASREAE